jgi:hypothetical protein
VLQRAAAGLSAGWTRAFRRRRCRRPPSVARSGAGAIAQRLIRLGPSADLGGKLGRGSGRTLAIVIVVALLTAARVQPLALPSFRATIWEPRVTSNGTFGP